jgi:hypothetical protein
VSVKSYEHIAPEKRSIYRVEPDDRDMLEGFRDDGTRPHDLEQRLLRDRASGAVQQDAERFERLSRERNAHVVPQNRSFTGVDEEAAEPIGGSGARIRTLGA